MKTFASILAFLVFFIPATGLGMLFAFELWHSDKTEKDPNSYPVAAVIVAVICVCVGTLAGRYSARATSKRYAQRDETTVA